MQPSFVQGADDGGQVATYDGDTPMTDRAGM